MADNKNQFVVFFCFLKDYFEPFQLVSCVAELAHQAEIPVVAGLGIRNNQFGLFVSLELFRKVHVVVAELSELLKGILVQENFKNFTDVSQILTKWLLKLLIVRRVEVMVAHSGNDRNAREGLLDQLAKS